MPGDSFIMLDPGTTYGWDMYSRSISSNTVYQTRTVQAPSFIPSYTLTTSANTSVATGDTDLLQLMAGPLNRLLVHRIRVWQTVAATNAALGLWSLYRLATAGTGGTALTPVVLDPADAASPAAGMTLPSGKGTRGNLIANGSWQVQNAAGLTTAGWNPLILDLDWRSVLHKAPIVAAGAANGIVLVNGTSIAAASVRVVVEFSELYWS